MGNDSESQNLETPQFLNGSLVNIVSCMFDGVETIGRTDASGHVADLSHPARINVLAP